MQEPKQMMEQEQTPRKRPMLAVGVAAASVVLLLAALFIAHSIFNRSYQSYLDRLKGMVAEETAKLEQGDPQADPAGQYRFYLAVNNQLEYLSGTLAKLNEKYPYLLTKATEQTVGLVDLKSRLDGMKPALATFKEVVDEDSVIAGELAAMLGKDIPSADYAALKERNAAVQAKIAGLSFTGALEGNRAALADGLQRRGTALQLLEEDAAVAEQFVTLLSDITTAPDDLIAALNGLIAKTGELSGRMAEANLASLGAGGEAVVQAVAQRQALLNADVAYLGEIKAVMADVAAFNTELEKGRGQGTKFTQRLAAWMAWVKELDGLKAKLKAVNGKEDYQALASKRTLETMGLSETGMTLSGYAPALSAVNSAMASSATIEKEINNMMKSKARMVDKVTTSTKLLERNAALMARIKVELPPDLAEGLANFSAGVAERNVFLTEYVAYVKDQAVAEGQAANRRIYQEKYNSFKATAMTYPADSSDRTFYMNLANDQLTFANKARDEYNASMKSAQAHKKKYEASRKKYVPMLDKVD